MKKIFLLLFILSLKQFFLFSDNLSLTNSLKPIFNISNVSNTSIQSKTNFSQNFSLSNQITNNFQKNLTKIITNMITNITVMTLETIITQNVFIPIKSTFASNKESVLNKCKKYFYLPYIYPGVGHIVMKDSFKGVVLASLFTGSITGIIVSFSKANSYLNKRDTIWQEAMDTIDYDKRTELIAEYYHYADEYNKYFSYGEGFLIASIGIYLYNIFDYYYSFYKYKKLIEIKNEEDTIQFSFNFRF